MAEQIINSKQALDAYIQHLQNQFEKHRYLRVDMKTGKQRTLTQNRSMHLYFTHLSDALNDAGYDFRTTIREGIEVPWNEGLVKQFIWRPVQKAITGHSSTTKPKTYQYSEIYEVINRHTSSKLGVFCPWPCEDTKNEQ